MENRKCTATHPGTLVISGKVSCRPTCRRKPNKDRRRHMQTRVVSHVSGKVQVNLVFAADELNFE